MALSPGGTSFLNKDVGAQNGLKPDHRVSHVLVSLIPPQRMGVQTQTDSPHIQPEHPAATKEASTAEMRLLPKGRVVDVGSRTLEMRYRCTSQDTTTININ